MSLATSRHCAKRRVSNRLHWHYLYSIKVAELAIYWLCNMHCVNSFSSEKLSLFCFYVFYFDSKATRMFAIATSPRESCSLLTWRAGVNALDVSLAPDDPNEAPLTDGQLYELFRKARQLGALVRVHCENGPVIRAVRSALCSALYSHCLYAPLRSVCSNASAFVPLAAFQRAARRRRFRRRGPSARATRRGTRFALIVSLHFLPFVSTYVLAMYEYVSFRHSHFNHLCV